MAGESADLTRRTHIGDSLRVGNYSFVARVSWRRSGRRKIWTGAEAKESFDQEVKDVRFEGTVLPF